MLGRFSRIALLLAIVSSASTAGARASAARAVPASVARDSSAWTTPAERAAYRRTPSYEETMAYARRLDAASPWVRLETFGESPQGRALPLLVVSRDRAFTPAAARATGKPVVLVVNGIHAGEIEGKDASLALVRDLAITGRQAALLDAAVLLVVPIFSVDGHERSGPYNRINQNGPEEMGWRSTAQGLNLNRDWLKAESREMRALIGRVFTPWRPHLVVDNHTTDGADYRHDLTYGFNHGPEVPAPVERWLVEAFETRVVAALAERGHRMAPYLTFRSGNDPASGIEFGSSPPRFSTGYAPLHGRPAILVETHMLKPYRTRVAATYDLMVALLEELAARPAALTAAVAAAESLALARARAHDPGARTLVLATRLTDPSVAFPYKGVETRWEHSDIAGGPVPRYGEAPWDTIVPLYRELEPTLATVQPAGYWVPREWTAVPDRLALHGVRFRRLARAWLDTVEVQQIAEWMPSERSVEGHRPITATRVVLERRPRSYRAGDLWVPLDQAAAPVAVHLLEAQAPDGLLYWNAFDTVLETKEYAEDYVMEPIARRMLAADTALAREFATRVATDTAFANRPARRLDFFYRRSPWADPEQNLHPAARAMRPPPEAVLTPPEPSSRRRRAVPRRPTRRPRRRCGSTRWVLS